MPSPPFPSPSRSFHSFPHFLSFASILFAALNLTWSGKGKYDGTNDGYGNGSYGTGNGYGKQQQQYLANYPQVADLFPGLSGANNAGYNGQQQMSGYPGNGTYGTGTYPGNGLYPNVDAGTGGKYGNNGPGGKYGPGGKPGGKYDGQQGLYPPAPPSGYPSVPVDAYPPANAGAGYGPGGKYNNNGGQQPPYGGQGQGALSHLTPYGGQGSHYTGYQSGMYGNQYGQQPPPPYGNGQYGNNYHQGGNGAYGYPQQYGPMPGGPQPWDNTPNVYPLSERQLQKGLTMREMYNRIQNQLQPVGGWNRDIEIFITSNWRDMTKSARTASGNKMVPISRSEILLDSLERAIKNRWDADSTDLIEILTTLSNSEKHSVLDGEFCHRLTKHWELATPGYKEIMRELCNRDRDESNNVNQQQAADQARELSNYFRGNNGEYGRTYSTGKNKRRHSVDGYGRSQESGVIKILTTTNYSQLKLIFVEYERMTTGGNNVFSQMGKRGDHFQQVVNAIFVNTRHGRPQFFANLLADKMRKLLDHQRGNDEDAHHDVRRILVTRAQIDLADILEVFSYNKSSYSSYGSHVGYEGFRNLLSEARKKAARRYDYVKKLDSYMNLVNLVQRNWGSGMQMGAGTYGGGRVNTNSNYY